MLSQLGTQLVAAAAAIPEPPAPFTVTGGDAISQAIAAKLPGMEDAIIEGLPAGQGGRRPDRVEHGVRGR